MKKYYRFFQQVVIFSICGFWIALILTAQTSITTYAFPLAKNKNVYFKGSTGLALTFNINWGTETIKEILKVLDKNERIPVTFFISGSWAEKNPTLVKKIAQRHYEIATLGYDYQDFSSLSEKEIYTNFKKALAVHEKLGLDSPLLARVPTGTYTNDVLSAFKKLALTASHWSLNTNDWQNPGIKQIVNTVTRHSPGDIVLLHGSDSALQTAPALDKIIQYTKKNKIPVFNLTEMISNGKVKTKFIE